MKTHLLAAAAIALTVSVWPVIDGQAQTPSANTAPAAIPKPTPAKRVKAKRAKKSDKARAVPTPTPKYQKQSNPKGTDKDR